MAMKSLKQVVSVLMLMILLFVLLGGGSVAFAQEATESPNGDTVVVVQPVTEVAPVAATDAATDERVRVDLVQVIIGLLTAFAAGGIVGIGGLSVFVQRLQKDTATITALEKLAASYPPETKEILLGISRGLENIGKLGAEVFDDVPVVDKPASQ
jgi:hypothetical protein